MDKETIGAQAGRLLKATEDAQAWMRKTKSEMPSNKTKDGVLASLRQYARKFRQLERAAKRKMCAGVFGPSQAGKSYLLSSLAMDSEGGVLCSFDGKEIDFLREINPEGGKESTGLVTRFTRTPPSNIPKGFPVHVLLLSETELVKIFANTYFCDAKHIISQDKAKQQAQRESVVSRIQELKQEATTSSHITIDDMEDLNEYVSTSFGDMRRTQLLDDVFWDDAIKLAPKLGLESRVKLYSIIWEDIPQFSDMLRRLLNDLERLHYAEEAFCTLESLLPREASIIDVETLEKDDFSSCGANVQVDVQSSNGATVGIARKNLTAIVAELTMVMVHQPAAYFEHTDLLDFPGYKARLETLDLRATLDAGGTGNSVEQFFRRGKVAYLFQRYTKERELTSLLLCNSTTDNIPGLPFAVEEWIKLTHGANPEDRENSQNALFYILTKSDMNFDWGEGKKYETVWDSTIQGKFLAHFGKTFSQRTQWVDNWKPGQPFNNLFLLRNVNIAWNAVLEIEGKKELGVRKNQEEHVQKMREAFCASKLVKRHFHNAERAFAELLTLNDGGISYIKEALEPLCDPNLKLNQIRKELNAEKKNLERELACFYHEGGVEEEIKRKQTLFMEMRQYIPNPYFRERFPELLNSLTLPIEKVVYLREEAMRKYDDYRASLCVMPEEEKKTATSSAAKEAPQSVPVEDAFNVDMNDWFGVTEQPAAPNAEEAKADSAAVNKTVEKDLLTFFVDQIIETWSAANHKKAKSDDMKNYYVFPSYLFTSILDEFDEAIGRPQVKKTIKDKFAAIAQYIGDEQQKTRRQASFAIHTLRDFVCWGGKSPATTTDADRVVDFNGRKVPVFRPREDVQGYPKLAEKYDPQMHAKQWVMDWFVSLYGMMIENATSSGGAKFDIAENEEMGKILQKVRED